MASSTASLTPTQKCYGLQQHLERFDLKQIEAIAQELTTLGNQLVRDEVTGKNRSEAPLPIALKAIEILSHDTLQYSDTTKYHLSQMTRIFIELVFFQSFVDKRHIYVKTRDEMLNQIDIVKSTLPKTQITTKFELDCSTAALKSLQPGKGLFREIAKETGKELGKGVIVAVASLSPSEVISPLVDLITTLFSAIGASWYPRVWSLRWQLTNLTRLEEFNRLQNDIGSLANIRKQGAHFSLCIAEMFMEILNNPLAETDLKARVFKGPNSDSPGLLHLAEIEPSPKGPKDKFWKTRYRVIEHLRALSEKTEYHKDSVNKLALRFMQEEEMYVANLVGNMCKDGNVNGLRAEIKNVKKELAEGVEKQKKEASERIEVLQKAEATKQEKINTLSSAQKQVLPTSLQASYFPPTSPTDLQLLEQKKELENVLKEKAVIKREAQGLKNYLENLKMAESLG